MSHVVLAREPGYLGRILSTFIEAETREVARVHSAIVREILKTGDAVEPMDLAVLPMLQERLPIARHGKKG